MTTTTHIEKTRRRGETEYCRVTVTREPGSLHQSRCVRSHWFHYGAEHVTAVYETTVTFQRVDANNEPLAYHNPWSDKFMEVVTPWGSAAIVKYRDNSIHGYYESAVAFVRNDGTALDNGGMWNKHGWKVGPTANFLRAHGIKPKSRKVRSTCGAAMHDMLRGKDWEAIAKAQSEAFMAEQRAKAAAAAATA